MIQPMFDGAYYIRHRRRLINISSFGTGCPPRSASRTDPGIYGRNGEILPKEHVNSGIESVMSSIIS